jgi:hypothetical protein
MRFFQNVRYLVWLSHFRQDQYSLPRWEDITVSRQGMYDDTYHFIPTQGWMYVRLLPDESGS